MYNNSLIQFQYCPNDEEPFVYVFRTNKHCVNIFTEERLLEMIDDELFGISDRICDEYDEFFSENMNADMFSFKYYYDDMPWISKCLYCGILKEGMFDDVGTCKALSIIEEMLPNHCQISIEPREGEKDDSYCKYLEITVRKTKDDKDSTVK